MANRVVNIRRALANPLLFLSAILGAYALLAAAYYSFTIDDTYIALRYAENWARGLGLVFNPGQPVEGYTNFLWVILLGALSKLGVPALPASKVLGVAFGFGTLGATFWVGGIIAPTRNWLRYLAAALLALYPGFVIWSVSGMETVMFAFLLLLGVGLALSGRSPAIFLFGTTFALAALTRPEGVLFFGVTLLVVLLAPDLRNVGSAGRARVVLFNLIPFLLVVGLWEWWRWSYYGYPLPNPFYVHMAAAGHGLPLSGLWYVGLFFKSLGGWIMLGLSMLVLLTSSPWRWKALYLATLAVWILYVGAVGGDWMPWYRFFVPVLPLILLAVQDTLSHISGRTPLMGSALAGVLLVIAGGVAAYNVHVEAPILPGHQVEQIGPGDDAVRAGLWLRQNAPRSASVAVIAAGAIPYYSQLRAIDYYGIVTPELAHMQARPFALHFEGGKTENAMLQMDVGWLMDQEPSYIEIPGGLAEDGSLVSSPPNANVLFYSPQFRENYEPRPVFVSGDEMLFQHK